MKILPFPMSGESATDRIVCHLGAALRHPGHWRWHLAGILRELHS